MAVGFESGGADAEKVFEDFELDFEWASGDVRHGFADYGRPQLLWCRIQKEWGTGGDWVEDGFNSVELKFAGNRERPWDPDIYCVVHKETRGKESR
jgi:hypothetical protein